MDWKQYLSSERLRESTIKPKQREENNDFRTDIESDFGRVIFSSACRRLHDKTQVFPLTTDDNIHSRLTHSMEVMNIGQSFVFTLCQSEDFKRHTKLEEITILRDLAAALKVACLVHDIGNPPFGHFGEDSLQNYFDILFKDPPIWMREEDRKSLLSLAEDVKADYTQFDGNAEGLRVLTKLQFIESLDGLNLTCASLGAFMKYPNATLKDKSDGSYIGMHKHGVLTTEKKVLDKVSKSCGLRVMKNEVIGRHPLSFLMEAADSICYLTMDIEDGLKKNLLTIHDVYGSIAAYREKENVDFDEKASKLFESIEQDENDRETNYRKKIMNLRTYIMGYLIDLALRNFIANIERIEAGEYKEELIEDDNNGIAKVLGELCKKYILNSRDVISLEITGRSVIYGILDAYIKMLFSEDKSLRNRAKFLISKTIFLTTLQEHIEMQGEQKCADEEYDEFDVSEFSVEERLRILRDYVSCMTDKFALNHYRKLSGQQIY